MFLVKGKFFFYDIESVLIVSIGSSGDRSIIYLACTFNIYPNRSWFETYKVVSDTILFEDNKGLSIIGMNTI